MEAQMYTVNLMDIRYFNYWNEMGHKLYLDTNYFAITMPRPRWAYHVEIST